MNKPYSIRFPHRLAIPVIASIPHSGTRIPPELASLFTSHHLETLSHTDWYLNELYDFLPDIGVTVLEQNVSRYAADVNRDPVKSIIGPWGSAIATTDAFGHQIYSKTLPNQALCAQLLERYHRPYHEALDRILQQMVTQFGKVLLIDLHSFGGPLTEEVCLGNQFNTTCSAETLFAFQKGLESLFESIAINKIYTGGYIVKKYAKIDEVEAIQVELAYRAYLDPSICLKPNHKASGEKFSKIKLNLQFKFEEIFEKLRSERLLT